MEPGVDAFRVESVTAELKEAEEVVVVELEEAYSAAGRDGG